MLDVSVGDVLVMRKKHPCGNDRWEILKIGMDLRLRCFGCGHEIILTRHDAEKASKNIIKKYSN